MRELAKNLTTNTWPQRRMTASHCALHVLLQLDGGCEIITDTDATSNAYYFVEDYRRLHEGFELARELKLHFCHFRGSCKGHLILDRPNLPMKQQQQATEVLEEML